MKLVFCSIALLMLGIAIRCIQHSQAMLERGVCELAHSFFHLTICVWQDIAKQALSVTKALAGNDNLKEAVVQNGGVQVILAAMTKHQANPRIAELGAATLAAIVLRNQGNSKQVMELNGHQTLLQAMKIHTQDANVQVSPTSLSLSLSLCLSPSLPVCLSLFLLFSLYLSHRSLSSSLCLSLSSLSPSLFLSYCPSVSFFFLSCNAFLRYSEVCD